MKQKQGCISFKKQVTKDNSINVMTGKSLKGWLSNIYSESCSVRSEKNDGIVGKILQLLFQIVGSKKTRQSDT